MEPIRIAVLVVLIFAAGAFAMRTWLRLLDRFQRKHRSKLAIAGETKAIKLLNRHGYQIESHQQRMSCSLSVDGEPVAFELIADFIVSKDGYRYVAEAKTGQGASPTHRGTRRQLLEYALAFDVDGVLLVDMTEQCIHDIDFFLANASSHAA